MFWLKSQRWQVFVSHAHQDAAIAHQLAAHLESSGLACWLDRDQLRAADPFDNRILEAIAQSSIVLVLVSRTAVDKDYVRHEISSALGRGTRIVPYFLERLTPDELRTPFDFKTLRVHSLQHDPAAPEKSFDRLARDLRSLTRWSRWPARLAAAFLLLALLAGGAVSYHFLKPRAVPLAELLERGEPPFPEKPASQALDLQFDLYGLRAGTNGWALLTNDFERLASHEGWIIYATAPVLPGYLYVFNCDAGGKVQWLFPRNDTFPGSTGANPVASNQLVTLPEGERLYELDETVGEERFFAIYSLTPWRDLETALARAARSGTSTPLPLPPANSNGQRTKGIAAVVNSPLAQPAPRLHAGQPLANTSARLIFRSSQHWMLVTRALRHVAPGESR